MLYREQCIHLCDRSTLQLVKWIETYEECRRSIDRENTVEQRRLISIVNKAYRQKHKVREYGRVSLFSELKSTLTRRSTTYLTAWVEKYRKMGVQLVTQDNRHISLLDMPYCQLCQEVTDEEKQSPTEGIFGEDRGNRDGSSDYYPP